MTTAPSRTPDPVLPSSTAPVRRASTRVIGLGLLVAVLALAAVASVAFGTRGVTLHDVLTALVADDPDIAQAAVLKRIPRTLLAILVGGALGLSGAVMQGVTRNPLADPGILGVNTGAALAVVIGIAFFSLGSVTGYIWVALLGASVTALFVYAIGSLGRGGATPLKLALAGAATSVALGSLISAILLPRVMVMSEFRFWQIGGVGGAQMSSIVTVAPFLVVGLLLSLAAARGLNTLALGDELAAGLGERVVRTRMLAALGAVLLCGAATAVAGPIGFVGLVVPHVCRLLIGVDHRWLLPASVLGGATLLVLSDVVGRVVARPEELQVGIVTALVGAPFFIWIVRRQKVRDL